VPSSSNKSGNGEASVSENAPEIDDLALIDAISSGFADIFIDYAPGSPEQALAWESALRTLPTALAERLPSLSELNELARKAWPAGG